jgi:transcriptional regulator with XRE-family HTH domain
MAKKTAKKQAPARLKKADLEMLKTKAEGLFMDTQLNLKQIAEVVGVSPQTLTKWSNESDPTWDELRKLKNVGRPQALKKLYVKLLSLADNETDNADSIIKVANAIEKLSDKKITIPSIINTMMDFGTFVLRRDMDLAKKINVLQKEYIEEKMREPA